jgi:type VI protein secretion system component VasK
LEGDDRLITAVITAAFVVALIVLLIVRDELSPADRWWVWVAAVGTAMGVFGFLYVPYLKRRRNLAAERRQAAQDRDRQADMDHSAAASSGDRD